MYLKKSYNLIKLLFFGMFALDSLFNEGIPYYQFSAQCNSQLVLKNYSKTRMDLKFHFILQNAELIEEQRVEASLLTTNLKKLNRLTQIRGRCAKGKTQEVLRLLMVLNIFRRSSEVVVALAFCAGGPSSIPTWYYDSLANSMYLSLGQPMSCEGNRVPSL